MRVTDRGAAERDQIALALADDRVHIGRVLEVAARGNGDGHRVLDDLGVFDLPALGTVTVAAHALQTGQAAAAVDGDECDAGLLQLFGAGREQLGRDVVVDDLAAVELCDQLHVAVARGVERPARERERLSGEAHGVFHALLAVFIRAAVEVGAEKLLAQIVVGVVPLDHVGAGHRAAQRSRGILLLNVVDLIHREAVDDRDVLRALDRICIGIRGAAGHPGLQARLRAARMNGGDRPRQAGDVFIIAEAGLRGHRAGPVEIDRHDTDRHHGNAALCDRTQVLDIGIRDITVLAEVARHRRHDHSVFQDHVADAHRLQKAVRHSCLVSFSVFRGCVLINAHGWTMGISSDNKHRGLLKAEKNAGPEIWRLAIRAESHVFLRLNRQFGYTALSSRCQYGL